MSWIISSTIRTKKKNEFLIKPDEQKKMCLQKNIAEYGYMMKITEKSDVYSYGVVVLEVLTGKQPIDPTIPDGQHVVDWVRRRKGATDVLDPALRGRSDAEVDEMLQVMGVALLCVAPSPDDRPAMKDVAAMLNEIRLDRDDYANVDLLLKSGAAAASPPRAAAAATSTSSSTPPSSSSFSGSSAMIYNSSSKAKSPFD